MRPFLMMVSGVVHTLWLVASLIWCIPILNVFLMWLCMHKQAPYLCAGLLCIFAYPSAYIRTFMYLCISVPLTCIYTLRPMYFCISVPLAWICIIRSMYFCISVPLACIYIIRPMYLCISVYHRHVYILYVEWVEYSWPTVPQCQGLAASGSCFDPRLCMFMRTSLIHDQCNWRCHHQCFHQCFEDCFHQWCHALSTQNFTISLLHPWHLCNIPSLGETPVWVQTRSMLGLM